MYMGNYEVPHPPLAMWWISGLIILGNCAGCMLTILGGWYLARNTKDLPSSISGNGVTKGSLEKPNTGGPIVTLSG